MSNIDEAKREVPASELGQIKDKYPEMVQTFEELRKQANEPQIQGLGQAQGQPAQPRDKYLEQGRGREEGPEEEQQGQTS